jgi:hypothetical protein
MHVEPNGVLDSHRRKMVAGNEIVMRHITLQTETCYHCRDKARSRAI